VVVGYALRSLFKFTSEHMWSGRGVEWGYLAEKQVVAKKQAVWVTGDCLEVLEVPLQVSFCEFGGLAMAMAALGRMAVEGCRARCSRAV
jgi:hypothetical protein